MITTEISKTKKVGTLLLRHYYEVSWTKQAMLFCAVTLQKT